VYYYNGTAWKIVNVDAAVTGTAPISVLSSAVSLNDNGVTTLKIADNAITTSKIADGAVALSKQADIATASLLGRSSAGSGSPEELTATAAKTLLALTKTDVGLTNVDNTTDLLKPISTDTQTALDLKANLASPTFTGTPTLPTGTIGVTQTPSDNSTALATTAYVKAAVTANSAGSGTTYTVGLNPSLGGYVFYVTPNGLHGLVAETFEFQSNWYSAQNLWDINPPVNANKLSDPAYHSTDGKNFMDWRLPTFYELNLMYTMRTDLSMTKPYWSSSTNINNITATVTQAYYKEFTTGSQSGAWYSLGKDQIIKYVRAVRSF
jgi:hypothetical protein